MPNQNFRGPHDDINVIDCHINKSFKSCQPSDKVCRFAYASWCPVCDLDIHRKRSKSECGTEIHFRKRGRDNMKTPSPKKCDCSKEYTENKEFLDHRDSRLDSSRVRTNLCELPTSYITGNCQINVPSNHQEKHLAKKVFCGTSVDLTDQVKDHIYNGKTYSSEIDTDYSPFPCPKEEYSKTVIMNGDTRSRVHKYINISGIMLDDTVNTEYKANFIKTLNKANGLHVCTMAKSTRDMPAPHKEKPPTPAKEKSPHKEKSPSPKKQVNISNSPKDCNTNKSPSRDKEKLHSSRIHSPYLIPETVVKRPESSSKRPETSKKPEVVIKRPESALKQTVDDKPKDSPKKLKGHNQQAHRPRVIKISSAPVTGELIDKKDETTLEKIEQVRKNALVPENCEITNIGDHVFNDYILTNIEVDIKRPRVRQRSDSDNSNDQNIEQISDISKIVKKKAREISPLENKKDIRKNTAKFPLIKSRHKLSAVKLRKVRNKIAHSVSSDSNLSERYF